MAYEKINCGDPCAIFVFLFRWKILFIYNFLTKMIETSIYYSILFNEIKKLKGICKNPENEKVMKKKLTQTKCKVIYHMK